jgi:hypothetical protein
MPANQLTTPTETTAPIADTTAGLWTFATPASRLFLNNRSGQTIYTRFNVAGAVVATHDHTLANGAAANLKAEDLGIGSFSLVSVWFPSGATVASFNIRGA